MKWKIRITILLFCISCSKDWGCPAEKGFSCKTINTVDSDTQSGQETQRQSKKKQEKVSKKLLINTIKEVKMDDLEPIRTQEVIGKVLITPYVDREGNLNSGKYIYTIDETPKWIIK